MDEPGVIIHLLPAEQIDKIKFAGIRGVLAEKGLDHGPGFQVKPVGTGKKPGLVWVTIHFNVRPIHDQPLI
jgi:hypothetical protein